MLDPGRSEPGLDETVIHDVLRNERRRLVLCRLQDLDRPESVRELSEHVATVESGEDPPPRKLRQSVYVSLHQTHLPKLDELDVVTYDDSEKEVTLDERMEDVAVYLEVVPRYGLTRNEFYLGLALLGSLLAVASTVGVPTLSAVDPAVWALVTLGCVVLVSSFYTYKQGETVLGRL